MSASTIEGNQLTNIETFHYESLVLR